MSNTTRGSAGMGVSVAAARPGREVLIRRELRGRALIAARMVVGIYGLVVAIAYLRWLAGWLVSQAALASHAAAVSHGEYPYLEVTYAAAGAAILAALTWFGLASLVFLRRSRDIFGLFLATSFLSFGFVMGTFSNAGGVFASGWPYWWAPPWPAIVFVIANALSLPWAFCFPDGRFIPRGTIALAVAWVLLPVVVGIEGPPLGHSAVVQPLLGVLTPLIVASAVGSCAYRYWHGSTAVERQQLKWILLGALVFGVVYLLIVPSGALELQPNASAQAFLFQTIHSGIFSLAVIAIPIVIGISIFRQGLLDIDLIINRMLAYVGLTAILALSFLFLSRLSNALLATITGQQSDFVLLASVVPVAVAFMPARSRAMQIADRFVSEHRVMTLLFVDIVSSTDRAYALGDRSWRELLERFRSIARRCIKRCGGKEIDTTGDGFFVTFEAPEHAVRCGHQLIEAVRPLGLEIRVGIHIGEVQVDGRYVEGGNVHLAARVMATAGAGEVVVSAAIRDVLAGSEVEFKDRGVHQLKGVPTQVQLFAAT